MSGRHSQLSLSKVGGTSYICNDQTRPKILETNDLAYLASFNTKEKKFCTCVTVLAGLERAGIVGRAVWSLALPEIKIIFNSKNRC